MAVILFETVIKNLALEVYPLATQKNIEKYKTLLKYFPKNPMYNIELLLFSKDDNEDLRYFVLMKNGAPVVLMPFWFRKISFDGKETGYNDISSPYGYSGPLYANNNDNNVASIFWQEVDLWYKLNNVVSEFIRFNMQGNWKHYSGQIKPTLDNVRGKILPAEEQWNNFKPKVRNNYRKSSNWGLECIIYHENISIEIIEDFYDIYTHTMERKNASSQYFYHLDYFKDLILNNVSTCAMAMVYKDNLPISAELLLLSDTTIYSFLGGTEVNYFETRPNDFLKIEVLNWGRNNGFLYYFLGGGRENNDSLYRYKKDFFPIDKDTTFYTGRKIIDQHGYNILVGANPYCIGCAFGNYFPLYRCKQVC